jgi:hypothetical protein
MNIEKFISYQIDKQFPSIFREDGRELVELVKYYYSFLEENSKQSVYNNRRLFEYRDIDNTLGSMVIFFKNKFMKDLPLDEETTRFIVKNILDLYRRKGTPEGVELFFRLFYNETVDIYYPAEAILKPSASTWSEGVFLQLYPVEPSSLNNLSGKTILGSVSKAEAVVDKILFILVNNTLLPILYLSSVRGTFVGFDDIFSSIDSELTNFGKVYGSLSSIDIKVNDERATTGNEIGDILSVSFAGARGGKAIVTDVTQNITGEITYTIEDSGFGYTKENTLLYVSNQVIFSDNLSSQLTPLEFLEDQYGNRGMYVGGNEVIVGFRMNEGEEFSANSIITTTRSSNNNIVIVNTDEDPFFSTDPVFYFTTVVPKNDSSPGPLYPENPNTAILSVKLNELDNAETVSLITDVIANYLDVSLDAADFNDPPAVIPMSGAASPVTIDTTLSDAFDLTPFEIGSLKTFINVKPGLNYINKVFAIPYDPIMVGFDVHNQRLTLETISPTFAVGGLVSQGSISGKITAISGNTITVLPYSYYGFAKSPITYNGISFNVTSISRDYTSRKFGYNGTISTLTEFAAGRVLNVKVTNSGYGYADGEEVLLLDSANNVITVGTAGARGQGIIEGRWSSKESHIGVQDGKVLQDSDFYQEYSYLISSKIDINTYKSTLTNISHLAGTKMFGRFVLKDKENVSANIRSVIIEGS